MEKYQHVERLGSQEVDGILSGTVYVFSKLDGSSARIAYEDGKLVYGSRNRILSIDNDNSGFMNASIDDERYKEFFKAYPSFVLYGEWLVKNHIKHYEDDAWRKFYVYDVMHDGRYLRYEEYKPMLDRFGIDYIPLICVMNSPTEQDILELAPKQGFLCKDGGYQEGVVIKNYDFINQYGRTTWAKVVNATYTTQKHIKSETPCIEQAIVDKLLSVEEIEKEKCKIENFDVRKTLELLGRVQHEFVKDNIQIIIKKWKQPTINFKKLNYFIANKVRETL